MSPEKASSLTKDTQHITLEPESKESFPRSSCYSPTCWVLSAQHPNPTVFHLLQHPCSQTSPCPLLPSAHQFHPCSRVFSKCPPSMTLPYL